ncbi:MAG: nucleotide exchange factor GrpE [Sebaldella sp.]|nr:nucleotide exchange factor GrpE [Sebaldella sp.]
MKKDKNEEHLKSEAAENIENTVNETIEDDVTVKVDKLEKELEEWKSAYTRKLADFQNYSKRKDNELQEMKKYAAEDLIIRILDNVDNLERAIEASKGNKDFDSLIQGVEMTLKGIAEVLNTEGLEEIEADGKEYDPYEHQAMMVENIEEKDDNTVLDVFKKGYKLKGKVIRPVMVKVNKKN